MIKDMNKIYEQMCRKIDCNVLNIIVKFFGCCIIFKIYKNKNFKLCLNRISCV